MVVLVPEILRIGGPQAETCGAHFRCKGACELRVLGFRKCLAFCAVSPGQELSVLAGELLPGNKSLLAYNPSSERWRLHLVRRQSMLLLELQTRSRFH
jgi:hypothetical protein